MRFLLVGLGSQGDVRPMVALGAGLRARGHDVAFPADRLFRPMIERHGLEFVELEGDLRAAMAGVQDLLFQRGTSPRAMMRAITGGAAEHAVAWARRFRMAARGVDAVIGSGLGFYAALSAAEAEGVPFILAAPVPLMPTPAHPPAMLPPSMFPRWRLPGPLNLALHHLLAALVWQALRPSVNLARAEALGLPPLSLRQVWRRMREENWLQLHAYSPALVPDPPIPWPNAHVTGAWELAEAAGWSPPEGLDAFLAAGPPPVYVGFGSMAGTDPEAATRLVLEALGGRRAVLATGWGGLSAATPLPDRVYPLAEAPHDWLLPRMALAVHHGGAGTTHAVTRAGIPSVVLPFLGDQPFWGERLFALGAAPPPILRRRLTAPALAQAIAAAEAPAMAATAAELGVRLRAEGGVAQAVSLIEGAISR